MPLNDDDLTNMLFELAEPLPGEEETEETRKMIRRLTSKARAEKPEWSAMHTEGLSSDAENHPDSRSKKDDNKL